MRRLGIALAATLIGSLAAAATPEICLPPEAPSGADAALVAEYRAEILAEYERFWSDSSAYIRCLDDERARALQGLKDSTADYQAVFDMHVPVAARPPHSGD